MYDNMNVLEFVGFKWLEINFQREIDQDKVNEYWLRGCQPHWKGEVDPKFAERVTAMTKNNDPRSKYNAVSLSLLVGQTCLVENIKLL